MGGGAFINKMVRNAILKNAVSIWLDVDLKVLSKRIRWNKKRPLLNGKNNSKRISKLYDERKKIYKLANYKISCEKLNKQQIVKKIISIYKND